MTSNDSPVCYEISGGQTVEKLKERIWRIQLSVGSLERTLETLTRIWTEFHKPEVQRDEMLLEGLTFFAVVEYTKCFNSEVADKLDRSIFNDEFPENASPAELSEQEFHGLIMNYRNMHLVHSDHLLKVAATGGIRFSTGELGVCPVIATRCYREDLTFYGALNSLATTALQEATRRRESAQRRLMESIKSGDAVITDEPILLTPVSDKISPREMWGLPERKKKK